MPRTKRPTTSKKEKTSEDDEAWKKLDRLAADQKNKIDLRVQMKVRDIELAYKILLGSISADVLHKTVGELKSELHLPSMTTSKQNSARSASHDDGYLTEGSAHSGGRKGTMAPPSTSSRSAAAARRSRSADASARKPPPATGGGRATQRRRSKSVYRTPALNRNCADMYPAITPKVAPHTPLTVLRAPRQGEMVVSMAGSPVVVNTFNNMQQSEMANCNIMLQDGTMLSLQPRPLRTSSSFIPFSLMDSNVLSQLRTLKDNLDKVVQRGEQAISH